MAEDEAPGRTTAFQESERLTNMASLIGAGVSIVPIPGTSAALSGMELLLMGAIAAIWGQRLTRSFLNAMWAALCARLGIATALAVAGDVLGMIPGIGTVLKPTIAGGVLKLVGTGMNELMAREVGEDQPAAITAEEAREKLEKAVARIAVHAPDLKDGAKELFKGDGSKLAKTLNRIFDLGGDTKEP